MNIHENNKMLRYFENKEQAAKYATHRPSLNSEVTECVMNFYQSHQTETSSSKPSLMVDVGCGSGQATNAFHSYFDKIIGIDISVEQLNQAKKQNTYENIQYLEGRAENMPVNTSSADLVLATASSHWFDLPKFFQEVERVLKPTGCLALIGYYIPTLKLLSKKDDTILAENATKMFENVHLGCAKDVDKLSFPVHQSRKRFKDVFEMIPFETKERNDSIHLRCVSSVNGICGVLSSFATYQSFMEKHQLDDLKDNKPGFKKTTMSKVDPLLQFSDDLMKLWGLEKDTADDLNVELDYNLFILLTKK